MKGHPRPGARVLNFDLADRYISAIEQDSTGFGVKIPTAASLDRRPCWARRCQRRVGDDQLLRGLWSAGHQDLAGADQFD